MKKVLFLLIIVICSFATNAFAQEKVRGIETKLVLYGQYEDYYHVKNDLYGIEFTNRNSIPVSVTLELWKRNYEGEDKISISKDIVLKLNESYLWKIEKVKIDGELIDKDCVSSCGHYYYKYEAYKLQ